LRFTVHRPPHGEVSLCWYRPSGGDVAGRVHVGVARPRLAGDAREDRLALAAFRCDVPTGRASLRRERSRDPLEASRSLVVESGNQPTPPLVHDRAIEVPLLRDTNPGLDQRPTRGAGHAPHVEILDSDGVEPPRQLGGGLFHPVASPIGFAGFKFRDGQLCALASVGAMRSVCEALLQVAQSSLFTTCQARGVQQLPGRQCRGYRHPTIDTDHAAVRRPLDWAGNVSECDMPATGSVPSDAVGLHTVGHRPAPAESDPPEFGHPHTSVTTVEHLDVFRSNPDMAEAFMYRGLPPRGATVGASEKVSHGLVEIAQRLLLHRLRSRGQPVIFGAYLRQLRRLLVISRGAASRLPKLLLLDGQVPHEPGMPAMLRQHHLLRRGWQQPKPRHSRTISTATDNKRRS
jgi:hypothetical protein